MKEFTVFARLGCLALLALSAVPAVAEATKTLRLDSNGLSIVRMSTGAGDLRIEGVAAGAQIEVFAEFDADDDDRDYRVTLEKHGDSAVLETRVEGWPTWWDGKTGIDLTVKVPAGLRLEIEDGSGDIALVNVNGNAEIDDGSGSIEVKNHRGNLEIEDGSGSITVTDVVGDVEVEDGSGSMRIVNIDGHVTVDDGSGSITIEKITRGLTILDEGSGGLKTRDVQGGIDERR